VSDGEAIQLEQLTQRTVCRDSQMANRLCTLTKKTEAASNHDLRAYLGVKRLETERHHNPVDETSHVRRAEHEVAAWYQHAMDLAQRVIGINNMFYHLRHQHNLNGGVWNRKVVAIKVEHVSLNPALSGFSHGAG
jgi:hypothetical protein